jgi:hypothetical protein
MLGLAGGDDHPAPAGAGPDQSGRPGQQGQRLLGRPVARRQQFLIEVQEHHQVGAAGAVQHGLGANHRAPVGQLVASAGAAGRLGHVDAEQG